MTWTGNFEKGVFPVKHRKFVKQLMSLGLDRNRAQTLAANCQEHREPYANGLARFQQILATLQRGVAAA
jgi:hypothetical protein